MKEIFWKQFKEEEGRREIDERFRFSCVLLNLCNLFAHKEKDFLSCIDKSYVESKVNNDYTEDILYKEYFSFGTGITTILANNLYNKDGGIVGCNNEFYSIVQDGSCPQNHYIIFLLSIYSYIQDEQRVMSHRISIVTNFKEYYIVDSNQPYVISGKENIDLLINNNKIVTVRTFFNLENGELNTWHRRYLDHIVDDQVLTDT